MSPGALVQEVQLSRLRGRGGAGFPTGTKWSSVLHGEGGHALRRVQRRRGRAGHVQGPGADACAIPTSCSKVCSSPRHAVAAVAAYVATKASFQREVTRLARALAEMIEAGWVDLPVHIVTGPEEYLFGEEKALLEVIEGNEPLPALAAAVPPRACSPPSRRSGWEARHAGARRAAAPTEEAANPTLVNNVETLANVAVHPAPRARSGSARSAPSESPGTVCCTVVGDVSDADVVEVELGTPLAGGHRALRAARCRAGRSGPCSRECRTR